jgi:pyridinium-3,5-bisthiocarboxylic acid mononucleotide nickel chelatase
VTRAAIFDPFSGIAGDMTLGALIQCGLDPDWLRALPARLSLDGVGVEIRDVNRADIRCAKVDFTIPPQPHGRHIHHIRKIVEASDAPRQVKDRADQAFTAIGMAEAEIHGVTIEKVHLHEVGAVDAILDVVGSIWGLEQLGVEEVYCGPIALGDGTVKAAHGVLPVPAPATLKLLEGHRVRPGPEGSGELVTPTGAALVKVLSRGSPPVEYIPVANGFGAGTKEFIGRANALRVIIADVALAGEVSDLLEIVCDIDDMSPEYLAAVAERLREAGALEVVSLPATTKRGRAGTRLEALCRPGDASRLEELLLNESTTIGVRERQVRRRALERNVIHVTVLDHDVAVKRVALPNGRFRAKPEFTDVERVALATGRPMQDIFRLALVESERRGEG